MRRPLIQLPAAFRSPLYRGTLLTGSSRLSNEIAYAHSYEGVLKGDLAWQAPRVLTWERWVQEECQSLAARSYDPACRHLIVGEVERRAIELSAPRHDVARHARLFSQAWTIAHDWNLWPVWRDVRETADGRLCHRWSTRYREYLEERELITAPELPQILIQALTAGAWDPPAVAILGIDRPNRSQSALINAMIRAGAEIKQIESKTEVEASSACRISFADMKRERTTMALWARNHLQTGDGSTCVGVLVGGLYDEQSRLRRHFEAVFPEIEEIDQVASIGTAHTLSQSAMAEEVMRFLRWTALPVRYTELGVLARSKYLKALRVPTDPSSLNREQVAFNSFAAQSGEDWLKELAAGLHPRRKLLLSKWIGVTRRLLSSVGWLIPNPSERELAQRQAIIRAINEVACCQALSAPTTWAEAVRLMCEAIGAGSYALAGSHAPIQVMGHEESRFLSFDALWVTGMADAEWPRSPSPNPMIPLGMQRRAQVSNTTHSEILAQAKTLTEGWRQRARSLVFSFAQLDEDSPAQPSALVAECVEQHADELLTSDTGLAAQDHVWFRPPQPGSLESYESHLGSPLPTPTSETYSTSLLEAQARCPFMAWAVHRLGLKREQTPSLFPDAADRGSAVHEALEMLVKRHPTRNEIARIKRKEIREVTASVLEPIRKRLPAAFVKNEELRVQKLLNSWLEFESCREPFTAELVEESLTGELGGIRFSTRVDRVDRCESGGRLIIDYKTGEAQAAGWSGERPRAPQLPLYLLLLERASGIAFLKIAEDEIQMIGVGDDSVQLLQKRPAARDFNFQEQRDQWREILTQLAENYCAGESAVDPLGDACSRCHLHGLCRVFELEPGR